MSLHILHVLAHSVPLHSGYTFRSLFILREQSKPGWQASHLKINCTRSLANYVAPYASLTTYVPISTVRHH